MGKRRDNALSLSTIYALLIIKRKGKKKKNYIYALNEGDGVSILTIGQLTKVANLGCVGWTFAL